MWVRKQLLEPYMEQLTSLKVGKEYDRCILLSCLFNFYPYYFVQNAGLNESQAGIKIARKNINDFTYAGDTTLMAESKEELKASWG